MSSEAKILHEEVAYNRAPYESRPFVFCQPSWTAAIARLYNLSAPDPATARVLELGCAAGGNIIALAARYPQANFVGIDVSGQQIAAGRARIAELGLHNIELKQQSLTEFAGGEFEYIIAHGLLSWVPAVVQDAIGPLVARHLVDNGVFTMSYNVLPGSHLRAPARDLMLYHTEDSTDPAAQVQAAREIIRKTLSHSGSVYGTTLAQEYETIRSAADYYLYHEYLEAENHAWYFKDIVAKMAGDGLAYISEALPWYLFTDVYPPRFMHDMRELAGDDPIAFEQYLDFIIARRFRVSIFGKDAFVAERSMVITRENCRQVRYALVEPITRTNNGRAPEDSPTVAMAVGYAVFVCRGKAYSAQTELRTKMFAHLAKACNGSGATISLDELVAAVVAPAEIAQYHLDEAAEVIFDLLRAGSLYLFRDNPGAGGVSDRPCVFMVARVDAGNNYTFTANYYNDDITLDDVELARFMALCDGSRTIAELTAAVRGLADNGLIKLIANPKSNTSEAAAATSEQAEAWVREALVKLAAQRLLAG